MNRPLHLVIFAALVVLGVGACPSAAPPPSADAAVPGAAPSARTRWVAARSTEGLPLLEAPARVLGAPEATAEVVPPFRARVLRIYVRPGQRVERGAAIMDVLMPELLRAAGSYAAATTRLGAYGRHKAQLESLRSEGMVRLSELAEVENKVAEALADQQAALGTLRGAALSGSDAARLLSGSGTFTLRASISGVITAVRATPGETHENTDMSLAQIAGEGEVQVEARLSGALPAGAEVSFVAPSGALTPLRPLSSAPLVDPRDGTTLTWLQPLTPAALPSGLQGKLRVSLARPADVVAVPLRALLMKGAGGKGAVLQRVTSPSGPRAVEVPVEVLATSGADALVRGALRAGDEVAADPNLEQGDAP